MLRNRSITPASPPNPSMKSPWRFGAIKTLCHRLGSIDLDPKLVVFERPGREEEHGTKSILPEPATEAIAAAFGQWLLHKKNVGSRKLRVSVGHDSRISAPTLLEAVSRGLGLSGLDVVQSAAVDSSGREFNRNRLIALLSAIFLEQIRVSGFGGWFLLRLSLHDPFLPLNIEAQSEDDAVKLGLVVANAVKEFNALDTSALSSLTRS
ncbi:hypothetical protein Bca52824_066345 [Brassica carinata]|uniref:Alpha-D-phosphohexomutase alpha/beta/alpha domain-containing protein n=1 Tax=Brassica carinata TaxID=52824 RepID=A0A8X7QK18_BRACI|nr:hypothetical protein Bca52824_066345 [Brassica carinata]